MSLILRKHRAEFETNWINMELASGWSAYGGVYLPPQYRRVGEYVELRGMLNLGAGTITVLPSGFRPYGSQIFAVGSGGSAVCDVRVAAGGTLSLNRGGSNFLALDGIRFQAINPGKLST